MPKIIWTEEKIKNGFNRFYSEFGRLPKSEEINTLSYLPSSRLIQKKFNGLENLRLKLGFTDSHFGKGTHRSDIAYSVNTRGRSYEQMLEKSLHEHFGEVFVHSEKMLTESKVRVDFYVYTPDGNFTVDIFYSETISSLQSNVNIKVKKYQNHRIKIYLVSANNSIHQYELEKYVTAKKMHLPKNIELVTYEKFLLLTSSIGMFENPIKII